MKTRLLLSIIMMICSISSFSQSIPVNLPRGGDQATQVDNYAVFAKRLGIPSGPTLTLDAVTSPQNSAKLFLRTSDTTLHAYIPQLASWVPIGGGGSGSVPTLQQVTEEGSTSDVPLNLNEVTALNFRTNEFLSFYGTPTENGPLNNAVLTRRDGHIAIRSTSSSDASIFARHNTTVLTDSRTYTYPNKSGTFALTSDIPTTYLESVVAGTNVTIDDTDPLNPIINATGGGGGGSTDWGDIDGDILDQEDLIDYIESAIIAESPVQALNEGSGLGWVRRGRNANNFGNVGTGAVDFSRNFSGSSTRGATGTDALATGTGTTASGIASTALGYETVASGQYSTATGYTSQANGNYSIAGGNGSTVNALSAIAMGQNAQVHSTGTNGVSMGQSTTVTAIAGTAFGSNTIANAQSSLVIGRNNLQLVDANTAAGASVPVIIVGNGATTGSRSNAYVMYGNATSTQYGIASYGGDYSFTDPRNIPDLQTVQGLISDSLASHGGGGSIEWGDIGGDIEDQEDLVWYISGQIPTPLVDYEQYTIDSGSEEFNLNATATPVRATVFTSIGSIGGMNTPNSSGATLKASEEGSTNHQAEITAWGGGSQRGILVQPSSLSIQGGDARYLSDYSSSYTNRSLVDKGYVDNQVATRPNNIITPILVGSNRAFNGGDQGLDKLIATTAAVQLTVPTDTSEPSLVEGSVINGFNADGSTVEILSESGVTVLALGGNTKIAPLGEFKIIKVLPNTWVLMGNLVP